jgi:hypothetical protein
MRVEPQSRQVRRVVVDVFRDFGVSATSLFDLEEDIVIDGGKYRGRTYRVDDLTARWLAEKGVVEFYDADCRLLASLNLFEELAPQLMAA